MTSEELRAAAERFIEWDRRGVIQSADGAAVCRAYLAEHPADDGEPVTAEWMKACGWEGSYVGVFGIQGLAGFWDNGELHLSKPYSLPAATRGQLRRLCAALGVPLKETA